MDSRHIAELLRPFLGASPAAPAGGTASLSPAQLERISMYIDILLRWNARINLTAVRDPEQIVTRHFGESLFTARCLFPEAAREHVIDLGSGAGFPGLPLKIWVPGLRLTLIESNQKKATFLREVSRALTLTEVDVFHGRAESYVGELANTVTLRAVERFELAAPLALKLTVPDGKLALLIAAGQAEVARRLLLEIQWQEERPIPLSERRILLLGHRRRA